MAQETKVREEEVPGEYRNVGKPVTRIEGAGKVTGETVYADDMQLPRMLHAKVLGSPYAHARIKSIDAKAAREHAGVEAVFTPADLPPYKKNFSNRRGVIFPDEEVLFYGQPVAAVLASDPHVAEHTWRSAVVHQSYIEPHSTVADYDASGELSVWTSTQAPFYIRDELAQTLGLHENKIRVTATEVGGGFGGKIYLQELMVAALAMAVQRPVKYIMSRKEDMLAATPAPQAVIDLKTSMTRDGKLTALKSRVVYDSGAFPGAPMLPGCLLVGGYYKCENLDIQGYEVLTNKVSVGALKAPGAQDVTFAIERHMDMMARELGLDPIEVRLKNAVEEGD